MEVQAALFRADADTLSIETLDLAEPLPEEVLVRLIATGVCHTDQKVRETPRVPRPIVLGHEGAGVVERVGSQVTTLQPGDHVVLSFDYCGRCRACRENRPAHCWEGSKRHFGGHRPDGSVTLRQGDTPVHGNFFGQSSFATYALCYESNAVKVRKDAPLELLGPLGCGVQTGAGAVLNTFDLQPGQTIAVFGSGAVGLSAIMAARLAGAEQIIAVDVVEDRLRLATELGATNTVNGRNADVPSAIKALLGPDRNGVDYALDTTCLPPVLLQAIDALGTRGTLGFVSNTSTGEPLPLPLGKMMAGGKQIRAVIQGDSAPQTFIPMLLDFYMQGRLPFDRMVKFYEFSEINQAFEDSHHGTTIKPIIRIGAPHT